MTSFDTIQAELFGARFSNPRELRVRAEAALGDREVPLEVLSRDDRETRIVLRPGSGQAVLVRAERRRHWHPYRITAMEAIADHVDAAV